MQSGSVKYKVTLKGNGTMVTSGAVNVKWTNDFDKQQAVIKAIEDKHKSYKVHDLTIL